MEKGQQDIYTAAVSRDQARIVFDDARQMCLLSTTAEKARQYSGVPKSNSLLKPPAAKAATIEGTAFQAEHEDFAFDMSDSYKERLATFYGI